MLEEELRPKLDNMKACINCGSCEIRDRKFHCAYDQQYVRPFGWCLKFWLRGD
jgi:succinate dehydrogenase/fumarate reductase-like Fe-S protein